MHATFKKIALFIFMDSPFTGSVSHCFIMTILPQTKKSNELVNKICSAIDLELEVGSVRGVSVSVDVDAYDLM